MATGILSPMPGSRGPSSRLGSRPGSVASYNGMPTSRKSLPVIQHPLAKLGEMGDLKLRGESRAAQNIAVRSGSGLAMRPSGSGQRREQTFAAADAGRVSVVGVPRENLPPLRPSSVVGALHPVEDPTEDWRGRSQASEEGYFGGRFSWTPEASHHRDRSSSAAKYRRSADITTRYDTTQLEEIIRDKLASNQHALRHMFKSHDHKDQGTVSKEALLKILYDVCGFITQNQFNNLLLRLNLGGKKSVSFEQFSGHFKEPEVKQAEWVTPVQPKEIQNLVTTFENPRTRHHDNNNRQVTATFCFLRLKEKAKNREFSIHDLLPNTCFSEDGIVIPPQLKEMVARLEFSLSEEEVGKLWARFDHDEIGMVRTHQFLKTLGLDEGGSPRPTTRKRVTIADSPVSDFEPPIEIPIGTPSPPLNECNSPNIEPEVTFSPPQEPEPTKINKSILKRRKITPNMDRVTDSLNFRFEEPYQAFKRGCEIFDFLSDGFISRIDFKRVLDEFGLPVAAIELDHFFSRCGIRTVQGQIAYNDFLQKYWNRSESGIINRIVTNSFHRFNQGPVPTPSDGGKLNSEELEAKLVDFFHGDFMNLLGTFRRQDKYDLGVVKPSDFKMAVERLLGFSITENQWEGLKKEAEVGSDGLVPYPVFLDKFNTKAGAWNQRRHNGMAVSKVRSTETPSQVAALRQKSKRLADERAQQNGEGRQLTELNDILRDMLRMRFHSFDKAFKKLDRKMTGRFHQHQLDEMLRQCGVLLSRPELQRLWSSLEVSDDGLFNFSSFVRHFMQHNPGPPAIQGKLPVESDADLVERVREMRRKKQGLKRQTTEIRIPQMESVVPQVTTNERDHLLEKIKTQVISQWDTLKRVFRQLDQSGLGFIKLEQMKDIMNLFEFQLPEEEREKLLTRYDMKRNGNFHYVEFMKMYTEQKYGQNAKGENSNSKQYLSNVQKENIKVSREWKTVRRAFQRADRSGVGSLSINDFQNVLKKCGIKVSGESLYELLSEFDENMKGVISYEDFLNKVRL